MKFNGEDQISSKLRHSFMFCFLTYYLKKGVAVLNVSVTSGFRSRWLKFQRWGYDIPVDRYAHLACTFKEICA
ncbi:hypothetical protein BPJM79_40436 [Bacillus pumilus]